MQVLCFYLGISRDFSGRVSDLLETGIPRDFGGFPKVFVSRIYSVSWCSVDRKQIDIQDFFWSFKAAFEYTQLGSHIVMNISSLQGTIIS